MADYRTIFNAHPKCLATADANGTPNVCMTGAASMIDDTTIVLAGGFLKRSLENITLTRKATFMTWNPLILQKEYWEKYNTTGEKLAPAGFRFHCILKEGVDTTFHLAQIQDKFRRTIGNRIPDGLHYTLTFTIIDIRELEF
ncbi:MAG: pyridoxamine 5'-phosphate oxidase family protein [Chitinivibrionales bacterium]|nr:pyridoxamine 5'-phosphate oxidase family protein [Chitinivibrionales bacterium]